MVPAGAKAPGFMIHTGDITQNSKPAEFDTAAQVIKSAKVSEVFYVPGEHDFIDDGAQYKQRLGKGTIGNGWYSYNHKGVHFVGLNNCVQVDAMSNMGDDQLAWLKLSKADVQTLSMLGKSAGGSEATLAGAGDAARGKVMFEKRCTGCHTMEADREGPRLAGVFGRKAGSVAEFTYSAELKNSGLTWNDATLEKWLSDPDLLVPDNNMNFSVPKAEERRDLIVYLRQF